MAVVCAREWVGRALEQALVPAGYATLRAGSAAEARVVCAAAEPDLVFIERSLPDGDASTGAWRATSGARPAYAGLRLCHHLRSTGLISDAVPVVVTTVDAVRRSDVLDAYDVGAWELWPFPGDAVAVLARCAVWVRAKRHADRVAEGALIDHETGFYTLDGLLRRARELTTEARRSAVRRQVVCVAFRVDPEPGVQGSSPSPAGSDPLLLAHRVREACRTVGRASDVFARVGRLEFAMLAPGSTADGATRLVARLQGALADRSADVRCDRLVLSATALVLDEEEALSEVGAGDLVMRAVSALSATS